MIPGTFVYFQLEKYVSTSKLKYYFAVDTAYVGKKLGLLVFPYAHTVSILFIYFCYYLFMVKSI